MKSLLIIIFAILLSACSMSSLTNNSNDRSQNVAASRPSYTPDNVARSTDNASEPEKIENKPFIGSTEKTELKLYDPVPPSTLAAVRTAAHDGFDRIVFEFTDQSPGYLVDYSDEPIRSCGSGDKVDLSGKARLKIRFSPAKAHTDDGKPTVSFNDLKTGLTQIVELKRTCDFEAEVEWGVGIAEKKLYRVTELRDPSRIVIDVKH